MMDPELSRRRNAAMEARAIEPPAPVPAAIVPDPPQPQPAPQYWAFCPGCRVAAGPGHICVRCGRSLLVTPAEEYASALVQVQRASSVSGCAQAIAGLCLACFGLGLLLFVPPVGVVYFVLLIIAILLKVALS